MVNDSIADMLTRMRNALVMKYNNVEVIGTKINLGIAEILKREGFIEDFEYQKNTNGDKLNITLKEKTNIIFSLEKAKSQNKLLHTLCYFKCYFHHVCKAGATLLGRCILAVNQLV